MNITLYHNPKCSKSRATLALLTEKGLDFQVIEYLKNDMEPIEIKNLLSKLGMSAREIIRKGEDSYKSAELDNPGLSEQQLIQAIVDHPILLERPIVISAKGARIGRPPEKVLEVL